MKKKPIKKKLPSTNNLNMGDAHNKKGQHKVTGPS